MATRYQRSLDFKMRPSFVSTVLFFLTAFTWSSVALQSLPNSPCAIQCGNDLGSTTGADIVCNNGDFSGTPAGQTFQSCVTCQLGSTYVDPATKQSDLQWALCEYFTPPTQCFLLLGWIADAQPLDRQPEICYELVSLWISKQHKGW